MGGDKTTSETQAKIHSPRYFFQSKKPCLLYKINKKAMKTMCPPISAWCLTKKPSSVLNKQSNNVEIKIKHTTEFFIPRYNKQLHNKIEKIEKEKDTSVTA